MITLNAVCLLWFSGSAFCWVGFILSQAFPRYGKERPQQLWAYNLTYVTPTEKYLLSSSKSPSINSGFVEVTCSLLARPGSPTTTRIREWDYGSKRKRVILLKKKKMYSNLGWEKNKRGQEDKIRMWINPFLFSNFGYNSSWQTNSKMFSCQNV